MKIAIAGLGSIGRRHLKNLLALGEKDIVFLRSGKGTIPCHSEGAKATEESHSFNTRSLAGVQDDNLQNFPTVTSVSALLEYRPDAVIISNPTAKHLDVAIPAAKAGCHLMLEKPISHSMERIDELSSAVEKGRGDVLVGFQYRFHPTLQAAGKIIKDGELGQIISARAHWGENLADWHPWEDYKKSYAAKKELGGGVVLTLCHPFDYLNWLLGKSEFVWAQTDTKGGLGIDVEDIANVVLRFPGGAFGSVHLNYIERPKKHELEIIGTKGSIHWSEASGKLTFNKYSSNISEIKDPPSGFERNLMFLEEMRHFLSVCHGECRPICTLDDGIHAQVIATQAIKHTPPLCKGRSTGVENV